MDTDDLEPRRQAGAGLSIVLDDFSVTDLMARIEDLKAEIKRCEDAIEAREASKSAADAVFR
ncbi:MAG: DUF1192 domain-containing protein [Alphaproteobacteria bacterium]|nr:MAG: DUF1192 domain-containing protein [Alphaproteobacteria bacterium]